MHQLNPYLMFVDQARDAMSFYQSVLGGELSLMTFGEQGMEGPSADLVMHAQLATDGGLVLMASDRPEGMPEVVEGGSVTLALVGDESETLHGWFAGLAEGGSVTTPLEKQMWGDEYGDLTDRFGMRWLVNISSAG